MRVFHWPYRYTFAQPAGTSRGVMLDKEAHFLEIRGSHRGVPFRGIGECGLLRGLSYDDRPDYVEHLDRLAQALQAWSPAQWEACWQSDGRLPEDFYRAWSHWPSLQFAAEQAVRSAFRNRQGFHPSDLFDTAWSRGQVGIPTNGLVWMGSSCAMSESMEAKLRGGYACVKLKIGALRWEEERALLQDFRQTDAGKHAELRVDANGAFTRDGVESVLRDLEDLGVHSIEQPLPASDREGLAYWCAHSPVPVALDESLIGLTGAEERDALLDELKPPFVVLKPSFLGGWEGTRDWIQRAERRNIGWWVTSALEGSIGLNAIAHGVAQYLPVARAQGLGTGGLYTNNLPPWTALDRTELRPISPYPAPVTEGPWPEGFRIHPFTDPALVREVQDFLRAWFSPADDLVFHTSGSTGAPKPIALSKELLVASARATLATLDLQPGYTSLLALSPQRIGGAMVLVRALVGQGTVDLASASRHPLEGAPVPDAPWDFVSLVPQQAQALAADPVWYGSIRTLLLGGADCSRTLAEALIPLAERRYLGFGMTETGSHFALASLNPDDPACRTSGGQWMYQPVQGVRLVWTSEPTSEPASIASLTLVAPHLGIDQPLQTNDLASPEGAGFVWWGRSDGAVNSAGVKLFPETIEAWVFQALPAVEGRGFATSVPDSRWGERLVWLSEPLDDDLRAEVQAVWVQLRQEHPHWVPKDTYEIPAIPRAAQGKVDRRALRALAVLRAQTEDKA